MIPPKQTIEFLGIAISRATSTPAYYVPKSAIKKIKKKIEARADYKSLKPKEQIGWVASTSIYARDLVRNYRSTYQFCENWPKLRGFLIERQSYLANKIVEEVAPLTATPRTPNAQYTLLKLFGIKDR